MKLRVLLTALASICFCSCDSSNSAGTAGSGAAANDDPKTVVEAFTKEGADTKALTAALKPDKKDYAAVFSDSLAPKVEAAHAPMWEQNPAIGPKPGQTVARITAKVTSADIKAWNANAEANLPGGYKKIKDEFRDGLTLYKFDFVEPGKDAGMSFDILVNVNGHWRFFPKPWRVAQ